MTALMIREVLGFHAQVDPKMGSGGDTFLWALAGCTDFNDGASRTCGTQETTIHVSVDSWLGGYTLTQNELAAKYPQLAPEDLGSMGYSGQNSIFVSQAVHTAAYSDSGLALDHYRSYNTTQHDPKKLAIHIAKMVSSNLKSKAGRVREFVSNIHFEMQEVQSLLFDLSASSDVACKWLRENPARWSSWTPPKTRHVWSFALAFNEVKEWNTNLRCPKRHWPRASELGPEVAFERRELQHARALLVRVDVNVLDLLDVYQELKDSWKQQSLQVLIMVCNNLITEIRSDGEYATSA
eukprot:g28121.t1